MYIQKVHSNVRLYHAKLHSYVQMDEENLHNCVHMRREPVCTTEYVLNVCVLSHMRTYAYMCCTGTRVHTLYTVHMLPRGCTYRNVQVD